MVLEKLRLDGRVAIVTGGSRGLGKAMATALVRRWRRCLHRQPNGVPLESAATEIEQHRAGGR